MSQLNSVTTALNLTQDTLSNAVNNYLDRENLQQIFGRGFDDDGAKNWLRLEAQQNFPNFPHLEILPSVEINSALGAYAAETNTIYISAELIEQNQLNPEAISRVILEEYGHYLDAWFNIHDASGDEGELFAYVARGKSLTQTERERILADNDIALVDFEDRKIAIEQANPGDNPAFDLIGLTQLRNDPQFAGIDGSGFSVAVIDTGVDIDHPAIAPNYVAGYDFIDGDNNPDDLEGHGTHVSGTIGAIDEAIGVATDVGLISLRALDRAGSTSLGKIEDALEWTYNNRERYNITAVNLSLGTGFFTSPAQLRGDILVDDIRRLEAAGVTVISAAGNNYFANEGQTGIAYPSISSTIAVGAVWQDGSRASATWKEGSIDFSTGADRIASFSQRSDADNFIFAPGTIITSTLPEGRFGQNAGTSQATPHIAGAVALLQEASMQFNGRVLSPSEVNEILQTTGDVVIDGDDEDDNVQNTGAAYIRVNVYNAVAEIKRRSTAESSAINEEAIADTPNDTIREAVIGPILNGSPVEPIRESIGRDGTNIISNDVDLYNFRVASPGEIRIEVTSDSIERDDFNSYLRLFDASGNQIAVNDDINGGVDSTFSRIELDLDIGSYYVGVSSSNNFAYNPNIAGSGVAGATGNYALEFSLSNLDPDGILTGAREIGLSSDSESVLSTGIIGTDYGQTLEVADVDLYRVVAPSNGTLSIDIDTPYDDFVDSYLRLFDRNGNELLLPNSERPAVNDNSLASNTDREVEFVSNSSPNIVLEDPEQMELMGGTVGLEDNYIKGNYGHLTDSFLSAEVEAGEVYYIGVSDTSNRNYDPSNFDNRLSGAGTGAYELVTTFTENDLNDVTVQNNGGESVYHFVREDLGLNFYTTSTFEKEYIANNVERYIYQGEAFQSASADDLLTGAKPIYRFVNSSTSAHLYTMFEEERDYIENNLANYKSEGIAYYGYEEQKAGTIPLYRLYNTDTDLHFYTSSVDEKNEVLASSNNFRLEADNGIAFYVEALADI